MGTTWYDRGAAALARVVEGLPRGYLCPLCRILFLPDRIEQLTVDHVPAEGLGGARMVLTCARCNHRSGTSMQNAMRRQESAYQAVAGPLDVPHPVTLTLSTGAEVRGEVVGVGDQIQLRVLAQNSPTALHQFKRDMQTVSASGGTDWSINMRYDRYAYREVPASVGWLREAYLVAFAAIGYSYALNSALDIVWEQIRRPTERIIPGFKLEDPRQDPALRMISIVEEPEWIRCVAVQYGRWTVLLPQIDDHEFYSRVEERQQAVGRESEQINVTRRTVLPWPVAPTHSMDLALPKPILRATGPSSRKVS